MDAPEAGIWKGIFEKLMDYILVAFADPLCCSGIAPVLRVFIINLELADSVFRGTGADVFMGTFKLIFPDQESGGSSVCESCICDFLRDLGTTGPRIGAAVTTLLQEFQANRDDLFQSGMPLYELLETVRGGEQ